MENLDCVPKVEGIKRFDLGETPPGCCPFTKLLHVDTIVSFPCGHWADQRCFEIWVSYMGNEEVCPKCNKPFDELSIEDVSSDVERTIMSAPDSYDGYNLEMLRATRDVRLVELALSLRRATNPEGDQPTEQDELCQAAEVQALQRRSSTSLCGTLKATVRIASRTGSGSGSQPDLPSPDSPKKPPQGFSSHPHKRGFVAHPTSQRPPSPGSDNSKTSKRTHTPIQEEIEPKPVVIHQGLTRKAAAGYGCLGGCGFLTTALIVYSWFVCVFIPWYEWNYPRTYYY